MKNTIKILFILFLLCAPRFYGQQKEIDSLKRILKYAKVDTVKINIYNKIADKFKEANVDSAGLYAAKANLLSSKIKYDFGIANALITEGNINIVLGNFKIASSKFIAAQRILEKLEASDSEINARILKSALAKSIASQGVIFSQESSYFKALEMYEKALKIYLEINHKPSICKIYNNIGIVYKSELNYPKALEYFKKALPIQQEIGEQSQAVTLTNIGAIYAQLNNNSQTLAYFDKAQELFKNNSNTRGCALLNNFYGEYYIKQKDFAKADSYLNISLEKYQSIDNKFGASLALYNLAQLYSDLKKYDEAILYAEKSLLYANQIGILDQIFHSEKILSELYAAKNNTVKSFFHYKNYVEARDSIRKIENSAKMLRFEMENEYKIKSKVLESKAREQLQLGIFSLIAAVLFAGLIFVIYNRMQIKKRLTLQKEVAEYEQKALHLQMNPHFVFNCLGSISSFIVQNGTDSALKYLSKFSKLMRLTLEYSKGSLIPIDKEIESLQNYLELEQLRFHNKFLFSIKATENVEFNMGIPPLLIQPFVENAILHGMVPKKTNGRIDVEFDVQNKYFICSIKDDGIGVTQSKMLKENSVTAHKSMALEITKKRLEIMEATTSQDAHIEINDIILENNVVGTEVLLRLPVQYLHTA